MSTFLLGWDVASFEAETMPFNPVRLSMHLSRREPSHLGAAGGDAGPMSPEEAARAHAATPPVYHGFARVVDYGTKPMTGMTAKFALTDPENPQVHPFKGLRCAKHAGHRLRAVVSQPQPEGGERTLFVGEASLAWWSDDPTNGMRVTIRLDDGGPDAPERHPLTGVEPGRHGEAVFLAVWAIDNAEAPEDPRDARRASRPFVGLSAVQQSQIKCRRDAVFQSFCAEQAADLLMGEVYDLPGPEAGPVAFAEAVVRAFCGVASRSVLNLDTAEGFAARQRWQELLRLYDGWRSRPVAGAGAGWAGSEAARPG